MKQFKLFFALSIIALFSLSSCESVEEAQLVADTFYEAFNNQDQATMETLLDPESIINAGIKGDFYKVFDQHWQTYGKVISHSRYSFSTNTNNGVSIVKLNFNCETEKGTTVYEKLRFVKRDSGYKIIEFEYNIDKSAIE